MEKITATKERTLHVSEEDGVLILIERTRYIPSGYAKAKWTDERVSITKDELGKIAVLTLGK